MKVSKVFQFFLGQTLFLCAYSGNVHCQPIVQEKYRHRVLWPMYGHTLKKIGTWTKWPTFCTHFQSYVLKFCIHDGVIKWKHFPRNWQFVRGIHRGQRPVTRNFDVSFHLRLNERLSKQSWGWWFETLSYPLWRHCNVYWNVTARW